MSVGILFYSRSGNNRRLAELLAQRLGAALIAVRPRHRRGLWRMVRDMAHDRRPALAPLAPDPAGFERLIVLAPVWDKDIAHPMKTALEGLRGRMPPYAFATLCGYRRAGQAEALARQAEALAGRAPVRVVELHVTDLLPERRHHAVWTVSRHRVTTEELGRFGEPIGALLAWAAGPDGGGIAGGPPRGGAFHG